METVEVFVPIRRETIRKNPDAGRTSYSVPLAATITLKLKGDAVPPYISENKAFGREYNFFEKVTTLRFLGKLDEVLYKQLCADPFFLEIEVDQPYEEVISMRPEPDYLYSYDDPTFYYEGLGVIKVSDLEEDCDWEHCQLYYRPTGEVVEVELKYERIQDALSIV